MKNEKKCTFVYEADHIESIIYVDVESMKRAGQIDSPEFAELTKIRKALPGYTLETKEFPKKNKQTYEGLRIPVMQAFIIQYEATPEKAASALSVVNKKKAEGLTEAEAAEQAALRQQYIHEWRENMRATLDGVVIQRPDGTQEPLKKKDPPVKH